MTNLQDAVMIVSTIVFAVVIVVAIVVGTIQHRNAEDSGK